ncbi:MAG: hypothetical protein RLZZ210_813 [Pseudomonadota bacterium]|jgi:predicted PurR-regulated permease PerM
MDINEGSLDKDNLNYTKYKNYKKIGVYSAIIITIIFLTYTFASLWITVILSFIVAYLLQPIQRKLEAVKIPKALGAFLVLCLFICIVVLLGLLFSSLLGHAFSKLSQNYSNILIQAQERLSPVFAYFGVDLNQVSIITLLKQQIPTQAKNIANIIMLWLQKSSGFISNIITNIILLPVISFYFLLDWQKIKLKSSLLIPKKFRPQISHFVANVNKLMSAYTKGQVYLIFCLACFYTICLNFIGLDKATVIGLFTACAVLIPYVGFAFGFILAVLIGVLQYGFTAHILYIVLIYSIGQLLESFILTPRLIGESIGLHPITVIVALIVFGQLLGFVGMLFALPLAGILQLVTKECYRYYRNT